MAEEEKVDLLDVDDTIPGQNYACLSFVSPDELMEKRDGQGKRRRTSSCGNKRQTLLCAYELPLRLTVRGSADLPAFILGCLFPWNEFA